MKKLHGFYKYGKFGSILLDKKVDLKPLFSEECLANQLKLVNRLKLWPNLTLPNLIDAPDLPTLVNVFETNLTYLNIT